jgi:transcriptional regulator with GAF, ATPase, and Fis domain
MQKFIPYSVILIICVTLATLPLPWNEQVEDIILDLQFNIRGSRAFSEDIIVIYIGDEDIKALNGWPISRDFYSYAINILSEAGCSVIGIDLFFSKPDQTHPEYDDILSDFIRTAGIVCLPMYFSTLDETSSFPIADNPGYSLPEFNLSATGIGYSNLSGRTTIRKVPLLAMYNDSVYVSFGTEIVRLFLGSRSQPIQVRSNAIVIQDSAGHLHEYYLDERYQIRLNHFGDIANIHTTSFTEFLTNPIMYDFKDKIVFLINTASGIAASRSTPLNTFLPASLLHITVAENLITKNYIRDVSFVFQWLIIAILILSSLVLLRIKKPNQMILTAATIPIVYFILTTIIFSQFNLAMPVFYPFIAYLISGGYLLITRFRRKGSEEEMMKRLLSEQIQLKEKELEQFKSQFSQLKNDLQREAEITEKSRFLAEERKSEIMRLEKELDDLRLYMIPQAKKMLPAFEQIICTADSKMKTVLELVSRVGSDDIPVLVIGETGTGKELIARAIHNTGKRKDKKFVAVNCGALSETLLESELFGHEKGSFTGAVNQRRGRFELADEGTIFLDEISETSNAFQAKLLRVLQEGAFERVGGEQKININIRIIAATNKNLQHEMEANRFRSDLFYRLNGFPITLPPLRERTEDIAMLAQHFLSKYNYESVSHFSDRAITVMQNYHWPGNVRELENVVRRAAILAKSESRNIIQENDLSLDSDFLKLQSLYNPLEEQILEMLRSLRFEHTAIKQTAKALGNRDRGTITEYFRGLCFEELVESEFDVQLAARKIAGTPETAIIQRVKSKLNEYVQNLKDQIREGRTQIPKGLPKKFHPHLNDLVNHLKNVNRPD